MSDRWIVCICGSMRYHAVMHQAAAEETLRGCVVLMPHVNLREDSLPDGTDEDEVKVELDRLHLQKIELADELLVIESGYIGESTSREIAFARQLGKPIRYSSEGEGSS